MVASQFKQVASRVALGASLLGAVILGARAIHNLYLLRWAIPEETVFFPLPREQVLIGFMIEALPVIFYLGALLIAKREAWSRFGRAVCAFQLLYVVVSVVTWSSARSFIQTIK